jgi:hypothetical protein
MARLLRDHRLELGAQPLLFTQTPNQRRLQMARERLHPTVQREHPKRGDGVTLAPEDEWLERLHRHGVADQPQRPLADHDLARLRRLLQASRDVDRVAGRQPLRGARHHLAGHQADPSLHSQVGQRRSHLERRPHRAQGVVLVQLRDAEHRHHRIADELFHRPSVRLDDRFHPLEVRGQQPPQSLRVEPLAKRRRARDVAEEDGDGLSHLMARIRRCEWSAARLAEAGSDTVLVTARCADRHPPSVSPRRLVRHLSISRAAVRLKATVHSGSI